jgi:hypothetical protein
MGHAIIWRVGIAIRQEDGGSNQIGARAAGGTVELMRSVKLSLVSTCCASLEEETNVARLGS